MDLTPEKGEFLFLTLAEFKEQICLLFSYIYYLYDSPINDEESRSALLAHTHRLLLGTRSPR
jgi:hypothetical protein